VRGMPGMACKEFNKAKRRAHQLDATLLRSRRPVMVLVVNYAIDGLGTDVAVEASFGVDTLATSSSHSRSGLLVAALTC
jgi:hypothetical protein